MRAYPFISNYLQSSGWELTSGNAVNSCGRVADYTSKRTGPVTLFPLVDFLRPIDSTLLRVATKGSCVMP